MTSNNPNLRPVIEIYEENFSFWARERNKSPFFEKKYLEQVLARLSPGDEVLDLGCGSGFPIADFFIRGGFKVTGVDAAPSMIKIAAENLPQGEWIVADMRTLGLGRKYAAIIAWDSFFHLDCSEQAAMFSIFRSHLRPSGTLLFTSGPERGEAIGDMNGNPLFHASLSEAEYRDLLKQNGFEVISYNAEDKDCGNHTVWVGLLTS